jgi:hypothetical protein
MKTAIIINHNRVAASTKTNDYQNIRRWSHDWFIRNIPEPLVTADRPVGQATHVDRPVTPECEKCSKEMRRDEKTIQK